MATTQLPADLSNLAAMTTSTSPRVRVHFSRRAARAALRDAGFRYSSSLRVWERGGFYNYQTRTIAAAAGVFTIIDGKHAEATRRMNRQRRESSGS